MIGDVIGHGGGRRGRWVDPLGREFSKGDGGAPSAHGGTRWPRIVGSMERIRRAALAWSVGSLLLEQEDKDGGLR